MVIIPKQDEWNDFPKYDHHALFARSTVLFFIYSNMTKLLMLLVKVDPMITVNYLIYLVLRPYLFNKLNLSLLLQINQQRLLHKDDHLNRNNNVLFL